MVSTITRLREQQQRQRQLSRQRQLRINKQLQQESLRKGISVSELQRQKDVAAQGRQIEKATQEALKEREQELKERSLKFEKASDKLQKNIDNLKQKKYYYGLTRSDSRKLQTLIYEKKALGNILKNENISFEQAQKISASEAYRREKEERAARRRDVMGESEAKFRTSTRKEYAEFAAAGFPVTAYLGDPQAEKTIRDLEAKGIKLTETAKENIRKIARGEKVFTTGKPIELPKFTPTAPTTREIITGIWNAPRITTPTSIVSKVFIPSVKKIDLPPDFQMLSSEEDFAGSGSGGGAAGGSAGGIDFSGSGGLDIGGSGLVSAQQQDLRGVPTTKGQDGYSSLVGGTIGTPYGTDISISGTQYRVDSSGGFFPRLFRSWKKTTKEDIEKGLTGQYLNITGTTGTLVSAYPSGAGGTAFWYPLTKEQLERQGVLQKNIFTADTGLLQKDISIYEKQKTEFEKLTTDFEELKGSELDKRLEALNRVGASIEKIGTIEGTEITVTPPKEPFIDVGFWKFKTEIPITTFKKKIKPTYEYKPPETILGEEPFNIWSIPLYAGRIIEKSYPYQKAIIYTKGKYPVIYKTLTTPTPSIVEDLATSVTMWSFFSPLLATGTFQKLKIKGRFEGISKLDEKTKKEIGEAVISKIEKDLLRMKTPKEQWKYLAELSKKVKTEEQMAGFKTLVQRLMEKEILKPIPVKMTPTIQREISVMIEGAPQMKGVGFISGGTTKGVEEILLGKPKQKLKQKIVLTSEIKEKTKTQQLSKLNQLLGTIPRLSEAFGTSTKLGEKSVQTLKQLQTTIPKMIAPQINIPSFFFAKPKIDFGFAFLFGKDKRRMLEEKRLNEPVHVFVKSRGKQKKITKYPVTRRQGMDIGGFVTDRTLSAEFSIQKAKGKAKEPDFKVPPNFYQRHSFKFRPYKIRKGVKKLLKDKFIENAPFRLDTASEVDKIHLERFLAQQRKQTQAKTQRQQNLNKLFFPQFRQPVRKTSGKTKKSVKKYKMPDITGFM